MRNLLVNISYNGANYHGYQVQANALSVAEVLQDAIEKVVKVREDIVGCSRTDSRVHANSYYFHMKTECTIPAERFVIAMNRMLPADIAVNTCTEVPLAFHARYSCKKKEYLYKIWNSDVKNPFLKDMVYQYRHPVDIELLNRAAQEFLGTHDFKAFCSSGGKQIPTFRTIYQCEWYREGDMVYFRVSGDGFLYHMVRIMVGTFLKINERQLVPEDIAQILESRDRCRAGNTARPEGLYLNRVEY